MKTKIAQMKIMITWVGKNKVKKDHTFEKESLKMLSVLFNFRFSGILFSDALFLDFFSGKLCQPSAYVSFTTAHKNKMASTNVIFDNDCPVWEYDLDTVLSSELLYEENKVRMYILLLLVNTINYS